MLIDMWEDPTKGYKGHAKNLKKGVFAVVC
jgi:hypothetical protein